jgi:hypothetical protein
LRLEAELIGLCIAEHKNAVFVYPSAVFSWDYGSDSLVDSIPMTVDEMRLCLVSSARLSRRRPGAHTRYTGGYPIQGLARELERYLGGCDYARDVYPNGSGAVANWVVLPGLALMVYVYLQRDSTKWPDDVVGPPVSLSKSKALPTIPPPKHNSRSIFSLWVDASLMLFVISIFGSIGGSKRQVSHSKTQVVDREALKGMLLWSNILEVYHGGT